MRKILIFIFLSLIYFSCKKEIIKEVKLREEITLVFPDTVYINQEYNGRIDYKSNLDTLTTEIHELHKNTRFLQYAFLKNKNIDYSDKYLKKIIKDTFIAETNRLIPLYNIKFNKLGLNYFDGIITDEVLIENGAKDKKGNPMTRIITHEIRLTKGVYVIDRPAK